MPRIKPQESVKRPGLSWSSGKEIVNADRIHKGLFIDTGLDEVLDAAAEAAGWTRGELTHMEGTREHWLLPTPTPLFVLIDGVPFTTMAALVKSDVSYAGLGARWPQGAKSGLAVQVLHPDLLAQGYLTPLALTVSGTSTDDLLKALLAHDAVLTACEAAAAAKGNARTFEFWEVAISIKAGEKVARGREQTSMISPILCAHPAQPDVTYLRKLLAPKVVADIAAQHHDVIRAWAADFARPAQPVGDDPLGPVAARPAALPSNAARMPRIAMATERQVAALDSLAAERGIQVQAALQERFGTDVVALPQLTQQEAGILLDEWQQRPRLRRAA